MSDIAIKVKGLGKKYRIGKSKSGDLRESFGNFWRKFKQNQQINKSTNQHPSEFWALKDVSFEIPTGEAVGIIGRNGAGKSTLLKILSRITEPTTGRIELYGRVSSLLEVGTGFHPELTGKENIYLNGTILGMKRREVREKYKEIVEFSGVEKFIDTPIKHYSSGMKVRLAFSVAAHLEPEILLIDEVLAVGDAEFQKKCLGKMEQVTSKNKTVLFVSHNLNAVRNLCSSSLLLENGTLELYSNTNDCLKHYLSKQFKRNNIDFTNRVGNALVKIKDIKIIDPSNQPSLHLISGQDYTIRIFLDTSKLQFNSIMRLDLGINNLYNERILWLTSSSIGTFKINSTSRYVEIRIKKLPLNTGVYNLTLYLMINNEVSDWIKDVISFSIEMSKYYKKSNTVFSGKSYFLTNYTMELC